MDCYDVEKDYLDFEWKNVNYRCPDTSISGQGLISTTMNFGIFDVVKMYLQAELKSDME